MVPDIGSRKLITAPIITDSRQTIENCSTQNDLQGQNGGQINNAISDKKVTQWKQTLHQIGISIIWIHLLLN